MTRLPDWLRFVRRSAYDKLKLENYTLRDALRDANEDLRRHRVLLAAMRDGDPETTRQIEKVLGR